MMLGGSYSLTVDLLPCINQDWVTCGINVGTVYYKMHSWNDYTKVQFLGRDCVGQVKGGFHRWQWKWSGKFSCSGWNVEGTSTQFLSRTGAMEQAVIDFMQKALQAKLITTDQIKNYKELVQFQFSPQTSGSGSGGPSNQIIQNIQ